VFPDAPAPTPPTVEVVAVYPPRLAPLGREAAYAAREIGPEALRANLRLDAALKTEPGVSLFRRTGSEAANPTIQGVSLRAIAPSGASRALVTLEGVPQNDPFGGWVIWTALPPEGISRARIVKGAGSGPYGAGALTGVIALESLPATDGITALDVSGGERGSARLAAAGGGARFLLAGSAETSDGYVPVRAGRGAADQRTWLRAYSGQASWRPEVGQAQAELQLSAHSEQRGAGLEGATSRAEGAAAALTLAQPGTAGVGGWRLQAWVRASDLANVSVAVAEDRSGATPANDQYATPAIGYGLNAAWQGGGGELAWEVGGDLRFATGKAKERFRYLAGAFTRERAAGGHALSAGLYGEAVWKRGDWLVTGGARLDGWRQSHAMRRERDVVTGALILDQSAAGRSGVTPTGRLAVRRELEGAGFLRAAAYAGFRPPTLNELHRPFRVGNDITEANPELKPERLYGVEAGVGGEGRVRWSATVFLNRLEDPIANVTVGIGPGTFPTAGFIPAGGVLRQRRNVGAVEARGLEADLAADLAPGLTGRAALAWTHARVRGGSEAPQLTGKRPAQSATVTATAGLSWRASERFRVEAAARYEGARFDDDLNLRRLSPGVTVDGRAAFRFGRDAEVYLEVENLTGAALEVAEAANGVESFAAPRAVRVGLSIRR
jgi:vitamin B12 transporter